MPAQTKKYATGDIIIAEGTIGKALYIIRSGTVEILKNSPSGTLILSKLGPTEVFGEMSLIDDRYCRRTASVRALEDCEIIILDKVGFDQYIKQASPGIFNLIKSLASRMREMDIIISRGGGDLKKLPKSQEPGSEQEDEEQQKLTYDQMAESMEAAVDLNLLPKKFRKGQVLIKENAPAMSLFMLKAGSAKVFKTAAGQELEIDALSVNDVFGEISLFGDGKRFVTVKAAEDGEAVVFSKKETDDMLRRAPLELFLIIDCMIRKLQKYTQLFIGQFEKNGELKEQNRTLESEIEVLKKEKSEIQKNLDKVKKAQAVKRLSAESQTS